MSNTFVPGSLLNKHTDPQPAPKNEANAVPLWPLIIGEARDRVIELTRVGVGTTDTCRSLQVMIGDMEKRHEFGVAKYGVPLVAHNDRDHLSDAYQELLDGIVYLRAEIENRGGMPKGLASNLQTARLVRLYYQTYESTSELRSILMERDGR
jgi:hypothetical protein